MAPALNSAVRSWLLAMQECVRERDFERARELFSPGVFAFGTVAPLARPGEILMVLGRGRMRRLEITPARDGPPFDDREVLREALRRL
jgi:hypothetical protein